MSQWTPPPIQQVRPDYGKFDGPNRGNSAAVASLVLGLVACVPLLTGALAICFGIIGIRNTREPAVQGKGLAVAGLILGIISVLGWTATGGFMWYGYVESKPAGAVAQQFLTDVSNGNINAALSNSNGFTAAQLQTQGQQLKQFGTLQTVSLSSFNISMLNSQVTMELSGTATFASGAKQCDFTLNKFGQTYTVIAWRVW